MRTLPTALIALLACANVVSAAPVAAEKPVRAQGMKAELRRASPLPKWAQPLAEIPRTERTDAIVLRLDETQALGGDQPAYLVNRAIQVNDRSALAAIGQVSLTYYSAYQQFSLHRVAIMRDGKVLDRTASVEARVLQRETGIEQGMVGGASTIQLLLEDVRVGDTLWLTYSVAGANPVFDKKWFDEYSWDRWTPVEQRRLLVLYPKDRKPAWRQLGDHRQQKIVPRVDTVGPYEVLTFEGKGLEPLEDETAIASDYLPARTLQFSEFPDWASVARWASGLFPQQAGNAALKAQADQFRKHGTPEAQAAAALHWVQDEIRYFSVSIGENSHRPQSPATVLKRRYGDCKDKSYLLISLLAELGIKARPVLLSAQAPRIPAKVGPSPGWFDHVIVEVQVDGKRFYVDPTRMGQQVPLAALSTAFPGASGLVVDPASTALMVLPEQGERGPGYEVVENMTVADYSGDATMDTREIFRAGLAELARQRFAALSPLELKKAALKDYEKRYPGLVLIDAPVIADDKQANQLELRARFRLPKAVTLVEGAQSIDYRVRPLEGVMALPDKLVRSYPLEMPAAQFHGRYRLNITWPDDVRASETPWSRFIDNRFFQAHESYLFRGNQINHMVDYRAKARTVPAAEVLDLHKEARQLDELGHGRYTARLQYKIDKQGSSFSARDVDLARTAAVTDALAQEMAKADDRAVSRTQACALLQLAGPAQGIVTAASQKMLARARRIIQDDATDPAARICRARQAFDAGDYAGSARLYQQLGGLLAEKEPEELRNMAWALFLAGQAEQALASIEQHAEVQKKADTRAGAELALIDRIALLQRSGRPLLPDMLQRATYSQDGPWPQPLLAMQAGLLDQNALLKLVEAMPEHARAHGLTEALFYIGQQRLAANDKAGAGTALRRMREVGIRSSPLYAQAMAELRLLDKAGGALPVAAGAAPAGKGEPTVGQLTEAANGGNAAAYLLLSERHRLGQDVPRDEARSLALLRTSAELGNPVAMSMLGWRYYNGDGYAKDPLYASVWFQRAASGGSADGAYGLGRVYYEGHGVERDLKAAAALYLAAARQGHAGAQLDLGYMYEMAQGLPRDVREAAHWYRKSAEQGNAIAQSNLGQFYADGKGVAMDEQAALSWYRKSAEQGYAGGMRGYGYVLENAKTTRKDPVQAHGWYLKAAELDEPIAQYNLAQQFRKGRGVAKNEAEAVKWYLRAAKNGDVDAMMLLGAAFEEGEGVAKDLKEAARWYKAGADGGEAVSTLRLGMLYFNGHGVARDYDRAHQLFDQASAAGQDAGYYWLGLIYETGRGRPKDETKARALYVQAESLWDANIRRAVMSVNGRGGPRDTGYFDATLLAMAQEKQIAAIEKLAKAFEAGIDGARAQQAYARLLQLAEKDGREELVRAALSTLADSYARFELYAKAEPHYLRLLAMQEKVLGQQHAEVADTLDSLAQVHAQTARLALAESMARRALGVRLAKQGLAGDPARDSQRKLAAILGARGDLPAARQYLTQLQSWADKELGPAHAGLLAELSSNGRTWHDLGQYAEAEGLFRRALALVEAKADPGDTLETPLNGLAWALAASGAHAESERLFRRLTIAREKRYGKEHHQYAAALGGLGLQLSKLDRHAEAEQALREALALREVFLGKFDAEVALALNQAGMGWARQGKIAEAEAAFKKSLELRESVYTPVHAEIAESLNELGALYLSRKQFAQAEPLLQRALAIRKQVMPAHPNTGISAALLGQLQRQASKL